MIRTTLPASRRRSDVIDRIAYENATAFAERAVAEAEAHRLAADTDVLPRIEVSE